MPIPLEAVVGELHIIGGKRQDVTRPTAVLTAPKRAARGRAGDMLCVLVELRGPEPLPYEALLDRIGEVYWRTPGTITSALRAALASVNDWLMDRNVKAAVSDRHRAGISCAVLRGAEILIAQVGPAAAYVAHYGQVERFPSIDLVPPAMGVTRSVEIRFSQAVLNPGDMLLLCNQGAVERLPDPAASDLLVYTDVETVLQTLETGTGANDLVALVIESAAQDKARAESQSPAPARAPERHERPAPEPELEVEIVQVEPARIEQPAPARHRPEPPAPAVEPARVEPLPSPPPVEPVAASVVEPRAPAQAVPSLEPALGRPPVRLRTDRPVSTLTPAHLPPPAAPEPAEIAPVAPALAPEVVVQEIAPSRAWTAEPLATEPGAAAPADTVPIEAGPSEPANVETRCEPVPPSRPVVPEHSLQPGPAPEPESEPEAEQVEAVEPEPLPPAPPRTLWTQHVRGIVAQWQMRRRLSRIAHSLAAGLTVAAHGAGELLRRTLPEDTLEPQPPGKTANAVFAVLSLALPLVIALAVYTTYSDYSTTARYLAFLSEARQEAAQAISARDVAARRAKWQAAYNQAIAALTVRPSAPEARQVRDEAARALDQLDNVARVKTSLLWDFKSPGARRLAVQGPNLFVLDRAAQRMFQFTLNDAGDGVKDQGEPPTRLFKTQTVSERQVGDLIDLIWMPSGGARARSSLLVLDSGGLLDYDLAWNVRSAPLGPGAPGGAPTGTRAIAAFGGNLYLLDPAAGRLLRYRPQGEGYGAPESYFDKPPGDLGTAIDLGIDGNVYVLYADGRIRKFFAGAERPFAASRIADPIRRPVAITVDSEARQGAIYVADAHGARILQLNTDGAYLRQFRAIGDAFDALEDALVDERGGRLFALSNGKLYVARLPAGP
jgi:hypothetical protein